MLKSYLENQAMVYYLGHSGWAVKTSSHFLIFDYYGMGRNSIDSSLTEGCINPSEIKDEKVVVFVSHKHPDHFDKVIKTWKEVIPDITYISGWHSQGSCFIGVPSHTSTRVGDVEILTLKSTDEGSGFLVSVDELAIFHAGDHANWEDNEPGVSYYDEIDYIANKSSKVDIAFIPVTTSSGMRPKCMTEGAIYALNKLKPRLAFPMHANNREHLYKDFLADVADLNFNILCPEKPGDLFLVSCE